MGVVSALGPGRERNPFCVQGLGPDGTEYRFAEGDSAEAWLAWALAHPHGAVIVAPCGFGKSTLVRTIAACAAARGLRTVLWRLHGHDRWPPRSALADALRARLLVVDGAEQWPRAAIAALGALLHLRGAALLLTAHGPRGSGAVRRLAPDAASIAALVEARSGERPDTAALLRRHGGNVRELFAALYDEWEREGRLSPATTVRPGSGGSSPARAR
jgi:hypothetical protein